MLLGLYAAFVAATIALMILLGPNVALITANSIARRSKRGLRRTITAQNRCRGRVMGWPAEEAAIRPVYPRQLTTCCTA
jgi:hypothetical protein